MKKIIFTIVVLFFMTKGIAQVGIGTITPTTQLDVVGDINFTTGIYYGGKTSPENLEIIRIMPTVVNNIVEIGNFNLTHGSHNFRLTATVSLNQFSVSKSYIVSTSYNQTSNVWQILNPITNTGIYVLDDFETDINVNNNIAFIRIRRKSGIIAGNISLRIENTGFTNDIFTQTTATGTAITPTITFATNPPGSGTFWTTTGNSSTVDGTNYIGTSDNIPLNFKVNNQKSGRISATGETFFGYQSGNSNPNTGNSVNNSAFGYRAFFANTSTSARDNTAIGQSALSANNGGSFNTGLGSSALEVNVIGTNNTAVGKFALKTNTASSNTGIGSNALAANTIGSFNSALGTNSLTTNTLGDYNVAIGNNAMNFNLSGSSNTAVGYSALFTNSTGINNTALGRNALNSNTANNNTAIGHTSSFKTTTGGNNVAVGYQALYENLSGTNNTAIGVNAMQNNIGSNNIAVGYNSEVPNTTTSNQMSIGNVIYGSNMNTTANGRIGIGVAVPGTRFQVGPDHTIPNVGGLVQINLNDADTQIQGLKVSVNRTTGTNYGVNGTAYGTGASTNIGLYGYAANATAKNWGLYIEEGDSFLKGTVGIGTFTPTEKLDLVGNLKVSGAFMPNNTAGNAGQVLLSSGAGVAPVWGSNSAKPYVTTGVSAGIYNISLNEYTIRIFNTVTEVRLPNAVGNTGKIFILIGSNGITAKIISTLGGIVYDDVTNTTITTILANQRFMVQSDGTNWIVIGN